jgi:pimeloyl-ACP methyl ester carboxylesterase
LADAFASALFVHGAGAGGWEWNAWRGVFTATGLRIEAPDLAPSAAGLERTALEDYLQQVRDALRGLPRPRALAGASLGGLLAAMAAGDADALVLVNPLPPAPWHAQLPARDWPDVVPWRRDARLDSTRRAVPDADDASALFAFRHWRDESGAVLRAAYAGVEIERPACRVLCIASQLDEDVPPPLTAALAIAWQADLLRVEALSHAGPLLGRDAPRVAAQALAWLSGR